MKISNQYTSNDQQRRSPAVPRLHIIKTGDDYDLEINRRDDLGLDDLMAALGTADENFVRGFLHQLVDASSRPTLNGAFLDEDHLNFVLAIINGNKPRDQNEAMLCAQMAITHSLVMSRARDINHSQPEYLDWHTSVFVQLTGMFAKQVEAYKRYRTGGEQKVTVQHVSVSDGGQAIVGNVTQPGRTKEHKAQEQRAAIAANRSQPMPIIEEEMRRVGISTKKGRRRQ